jgi:hypothetical protein
MALNSAPVWPSRLTGPADSWRKNNVCRYIAGFDYLANGRQLSGILDASRNSTIGKRQPRIGKHLRCEDLGSVCVSRFERAAPLREGSLGSPGAHHCHDRARRVEVTLGISKNTHHQKQPVRNCGRNYQTLPLRHCDGSTRARRPSIGIPPFDPSLWGYRHEPASCSQLALA